ncbi:MAG: DUF4153 domain-containing protein, partial [Cytophagaceae bacterium]|nr:DUF4153 domain-containing protein [Cytophagaceae bacterium]
YFVLLITAHLMAAVAALFIKKKHTCTSVIQRKPFPWNFISLLYSVTLAINAHWHFEGKELFELNFSEHWIGYIWVFCIGTVNTLIFLFPKIPALTEIDKESSFPLALKYFTQYVLLPLVAVYLLATLAYAGKSYLGMWSLAKGYVRHIEFAA